jgi:hypothetical protein
MTCELNQLRAHGARPDEIVQTNELHLLPSGVVLTERVSAALRAYLDANEMEEYEIFVSFVHDFADLELMLDQLGEKTEWRPFPALIDGPALTGMNLDRETLRSWRSGVLHLPKHRVLFARWYWLTSKTYGAVNFTLVAAPSPREVTTLRREVLAIRRRQMTAHWQIVRGGHGGRYEHVARETTSVEDLILAPEVRARITDEVLSFFTEPVAELYRTLGVPYRRGVLMHGPPGNGKTSIVRWIGSALPHIPMLVLRPCHAFSSDDLEGVMEHWREQAPAALVIEDLDWLLAKVNVSTFLNLLDGVETQPGEGLLVLATTNHPERLDPAVNNRPGRFDVVMEVPLPDEPARRAYLSRKLPGVSGSMLERLVCETRGLAFCHLLEIVRLSGMVALGASRRQRTEDDIVRALRMVTESNASAQKGFVAPPDEPFGLRSKRGGQK